MSVRFPGAAEPAVVPIAWEAWTRPSGVVRFGGSAEPATVGIDLEAWTRTPASTPAPASEPPTPSPIPRRTSATVAPQATTSAPTPRPTATPRPAATLAPPPTELLGALAHAQQATADAHAAYLRLQRAHLDALDDVQQALARVLERGLD